MPKLMTLAVLVVLILPLTSSKDAAELETYLDCEDVKKVDIIFVFDTTNSMGGEISELRAVANKFATDLEASNIDFQLGLVEFRDFPDTCDGFSCGSPGDFAYQVKGNGTLTSDISTFSSWLKELKAGGGGSPGPEAVLTALRHAATDMTGRPDAEKAIIVLTDAGPHPDGSCCNAEGDTLEGTVFTLTDQGARVYVIGPDDASLKQIATNTGGQFYEIRSGLSLKPLLEEITQSMSCSFNVVVETTCKDKQLESTVQLVGKETVPYVKGQTEVWMYLDQAGSISRYNLSYDSAKEVYKAVVLDACGPVEMTVYGRVGERSAAQMVHVECGTCEAAAEAAAQGSLSISGRVFDDSNGDGVKDVDEAGLEGGVVLLEGPDGYSADAKTDRKGFYIFTGLLPGGYALEAVSTQEDWTATNPEEEIQTVELVDAHESEIDFGFELLSVNQPPLMEIIAENLSMGRVKGSTDVTFSSDGRILAFPEEIDPDEGLVDTTLWDVANHTKIYTLETSGGNVAFSPDGHTLAYRGYADNRSTAKFYLWDMANNSEIDTLETMAAWSGPTVAFSSDGQMLAGSCVNSFQIWDVDRLTDIWHAIGRKLGRGSGDTYVAFSPDDHMLAFREGDGNVTLWDMVNHIKMRTLNGLEELANSNVAFSPDGRILAYAGQEDKFYLWDVQSGTKIRTLEYNATLLETGIAFSPDGETLASGSNGGTIRLWDVGSGMKLQDLEGHTDTVYSVAFSPDGKTLASGSYDGTIRLWRIPSAQDAAQS